MLFSSWYYLPFLFLLLGVYWFIARSPEARLKVITLASILLIGLESWQTVVILSFLGAVTYYCARLLRRKSSLGLLLSTVTLPIGTLVYFKYIFELQGQHGFFSIPMLAVPIGTSYFTFKQVHYLIDSARGRIEGHGIWDFLAYLFFFPMFKSGPIERFPNFFAQSKSVTLAWDDVSSGLERVVAGTFKKLILVDLVLHPLFVYKLDLGHIHDNGALKLSFLPIYAFLLLLNTYLDFSAYTDLAVGTGRFFGYKLMENFNFPLLRPNLTEFWRSWHISLSSWVRDYVFFPMMIRTRVTEIALLSSMVTMGLWHGASLQWLGWGFHHGVGLIGLGYFQRFTGRYPSMRRLRESFPWRVGGVLLVWWYVSLGYLLIQSPKLYFTAISFGMIGDGR